MWERLKKSPIFWILSVIVAIAIAITLYIKLRPTEEQETETEAEPSETSAQTSARIYRYLIENGVPRQMALIIVAQAMHETGVYSSNLARNYNNYFGMMQPLKRETTSKGPTPKGFASYDSLEDSVADLMLWLKEFDAPN